MFFSGQSFFFPAVAVVLREGFLACFEDFSVVLLNYGLKVVCAAITDFYVVFVENLVVAVIFRKMFIDKVQKLSADVCLNVHDPLHRQQLQPSAHNNKTPTSSHRPTDLRHFLKQRTL